MNNLIHKLLILITTGLVASCGSSSNVSTNTTPDITTPSQPLAKTVIVVGAGISGIKAAHQLDAAGFDVQVLEGRDRIGGRTWTDNSLGAPIDLGASWIHGINGNPLYELAQQQNLPLHTWDYDNSVLYNQQGEIDSNLENRLQSVESDMENWAFTALMANSNATVLDALNIGRNNGDLDDFSEAEIAYIETGYIEHEIAADVSDIAIQPLNSIDGFNGSEVVFPQGYDALTKNLAQQLNVQLNTWVSEIDYSGEQIKVSTSKGNFSADYVIVTVPLGVLKKQKINFTPALPEDKLNAINSLDMGVLNKVYLKFDSIFWDNSITNMAKISEQKGQFVDWLNLEPATGMPILMAFNGAEFAKQTEQMSEQQVVDQAMNTLRSMYGQDIPLPAKYVVTRWHNDTFSYGSYSYVPKGATANMREDLAEPVQNRVFFAGEATHSDYPSTVHGAYLSGEREAERIIALE